MLPATSNEKMALILARKAEHRSNASIAREFKVSEATVHNIVNGKRKPRFARKFVALPDPPPDYQDFSILGDEVLFKHSRPCDFVG